MKAQNLHSASYFPTPKERDPEQLLSEIQKSCDSWPDNGEENTEARLALRQFYIALKKLKPDHLYKLASTTTPRISSICLQWKRTFLDGKYTRACNESRSLLHNNPFL